MILITFATLMEAEDTIRKLNAKKTTPNNYTCSYGTILITGMGPHPTQKSLEQADSYDVVFNIGIVGALKMDIPSFSYHTIQSVHRDLSTIKLSSTGKKLITVSTPLHNELIRDELGENFDLVDMEGYVVASFAKKMNIPCYMHKIVSDFCNPDTSLTIRNLLPKLSYELSNITEEELRKFSEVKRI